MATVDPDDDTLRRYVVRHYAYDSHRRERRHQVVAAFDNEREFRALLDALADELRLRRAGRDPVDPREHYSGVVQEPGHRRRRQDGRLLRQAVRHGVALSDELLARLDRPPNVGVLRTRR